MGPYVGGGRLPDVMKLTTGHQGKARIKTSAPVLDESLSFLEGYLGIDFFFLCSFGMENSVIVNYVLLV